MVGKLAAAACIGAPVSAVIATRQARPLLRFTATGTASYVLVMGCFSAAQEAARAVRCDNSPANSAVGGAATGAALFALNGASAPRGALLCAAFASSLHWASDRWNLEGGVRRWLQARGLLDKQLGPGERPAGALPEGAERPEPIYMVWAQRYLPLTKMTKEEAEQHGADKQRQRELGDRAPPPES